MSPKNDQFDPSGPYNDRGGLDADLFDIFETPAAAKPTTAPPAAETPAAGPAKIIRLTKVQVPESVLNKIYEGAPPAIYSREEVCAQAQEYIESMIELYGFCILPELPAWMYHAMPWVSSTLLKRYAKLPSTCKEPFKMTDDKAVGSGIHAFTLQGEEALWEECAIMPEACEGRSVKALEARAVFEKFHPGKVPLPHRYGTGEAASKPLIMDVIRGVDKSFREHDKTREILANCETELSLFWRDLETGLLCKVRLDIWSQKVIWDVKKTKDLDRFKWQITELFYDIQLGFYFTGAVACRLAPVAAGFLPCEAFHPYRVGAGYLNSDNPNKLADAIHEASRLLRLLKESITFDFWPNYKAPGHIFSWEQMVPNDLIEIY